MTKKKTYEQKQTNEDERHLGVFLVRSFRESHLPDVEEKIKDYVENYKFMGKWHSFRLMDTVKELDTNFLIKDAILNKINEAAITIVILDGMRLNVAFELGYLLSKNKPFILLKHRKWGPSFSELDMNFSDIKGVVVKSYDHKHEDEFKDIFLKEFERCISEYLPTIQTHSILMPRGIDLISQGCWKRGKHEGSKKHVIDSSHITLNSWDPLDKDLTIHIQNSTRFFVEFELPEPNSKFTI